MARERFDHVGWSSKIQNDPRQNSLSRINEPHPYRASKVVLARPSSVWYHIHIPTRVFADDSPRVASSKETPLLS